MLGRFVLLSACLVLTSCTDAPSESESAVPDTPPADTSSGDVAANDTQTLPVDSALPTPDAMPDAMPDTTTPIPEDTQAPLPPCDIPLTLTPAAPTVAAFGYLKFGATGGTGDVRFELQANGSNAKLNELTGAYLAGEIPHTIDVVRVSDNHCAGSASTEITVVERIVVLPSEVSLPPGACVQFEVSGGSGELLFENLAAVPSGTITPQGHYTAGDTTGSDLIRVTDVATGRTADAITFIQPDAGLKANADQLLIPRGSATYRPVSGGSGHYQFETLGEVIYYENGWLHGEQEGTGEVQVTDLFVGCIGDNKALSTTVPVTVVAGLNVPTKPFGTGTESDATAPGDLDGDGIPEAVIGIAQSNIQGRATGAALVYKGTPQGFETEPIQILAGSDRDANFARRLTSADLNDDGRNDLIVTAVHNDLFGGNAGAVFIYHGLEAGYFEQSPGLTLLGDKSDEHFGAGVAVCDFNGDGFVDLAVGAQRGENELAPTVFGAQGQVVLYLGSAEGIDDKPDTSRFGLLLDDNGFWVGTFNLHFGSSLSAGDFDDDGYCDLAVGAERYANSEESVVDGAVFLFRGHPSKGLHKRPSRMWAATDPDNPNSQFGERTALGDLDGDGFADLVITQREHDRVGATDCGAVHIMRGETLGEEDASSLLTPADADWTVEGDDPQDRFGRTVGFGDFDGDGRTDLLVGQELDENEGGLPNTGTIHVYRGRSNLLPDITPTRVIPGGLANDGFGAAIAVAGDLNGDGANEFVTTASHADDYGPNLGRPYAVWGVPLPTIPWGASWRFDDQGTDHGLAFRTLDFDDSDWSTGDGAFGYGDGDETTLVQPDIPTVYFRHVVTLDETPLWADLQITYDDGVAVWINGTLVFSQNMGNGFDYGAAASHTSIDNQLSKVPVGIDGDTPFVVGDNIIAAMVKQAEGEGDDLSFDLLLRLHSAAETLDESVVPLEMPIRISSSQTGRSARIIPDVTHDGIEDLLVGAPENTANDITARLGSAFLFRGTNNGFESSPALEWVNFPLHHGGVRLGFRVDGGDFDGDGQNDVFLLARNRAQNYSYEEEWSAPAACQEYKGSAGGTFVFRGNSTGLPDTEPSFVVFGPQAGRETQMIESGFDFNGDQREDLVLGSPRWNRPFEPPEGVLLEDVPPEDIPNNTGGLMFVAGRPANSGPSLVICEPDAYFLGPKRNDQVGRSAAALGDLNGDGCDEVAVGGHLEDATEDDDNQGSVRVFFGWGPSCDYDEPHHLFLLSGVNNARAGFSLASGHDLDGDNSPDLVVGAPEFRIGNLRPGAVWVIRGSYLASLTPLPSQGELTGSNAHGFAASPSEETLLLGGVTRGRFGESVAIVPGRGFVVGSPRGDLSTVPSAGGVELFGFSGPALDVQPRAILSGETHRPGGLLGDWVDGGLVGGKPCAIAAGYQASPTGYPQRIDDGGVYVLTLP